MGILSEGQLVFCHVLKREFIREFRFLSDVVAGRSQARADFTDKLLGVIGAVAGGIPKIGEAIKLAQEVCAGFHDYRRGRRIAVIGSLADEINETKLEILIDEVAREAARRYAHFINDFCHDEMKRSVIPFAKAGAERILEYLSRESVRRIGKKQPPLALTVDNLLTGFIEGNSGSYVSGWKNTPIQGKLPHQVDLTAEGAYRRAGLLTQDGDCHFDREPRQVGRLSGKAKNFGRKLNKKRQGQVPMMVKFTPSGNESAMVKYGFSWVPKQLVEHYGYGHPLPHREIPEEKSVERVLKCTRVVDASVIHSYLAEMMERSAIKRPIQSLNDYVGGWAVFRGELMDADLTVGDVSEADFSGSRFVRCKLGKSIGTFFTGAEWEDVEVGATGDLRDAVLDRVIFRRVKIVGANLNQIDRGTQLRYARFEEGCEFTDVRTLGIQLEGTDFGSMPIRQQGEECEDITALQATQSQELTALREAFTVLRDRCAQQEIDHTQEAERVNTLAQQLEKKSDDVSAMYQEWVDYLLNQGQRMDTLEVEIRGLREDTNKAITERRTLGSRLVAQDGRIQTLWKFMEAYQSQPTLQEGDNVMKSEEKHASDDDALLVLSSNQGDEEPSVACQTAQQVADRLFSHIKTALLKSPALIESVDLQLNYLCAYWQAGGEQLKVEVESRQAEDEATPQQQSKLCINKAASQIDDIQVSVVARELKENPSVRYVDLQNNQISPAGWRKLFNDLVDHPVIERIDLYGNVLGDDSMQGLATLLMCSESLHYLDINQNGIGLAGMEHLAKGLRENRSLVFLDVGYNQFGDKALSALVNAVQQHPTLRNIRLGGNKLTDECAESLYYLLETNPRIIDLELNNNALSPDVQGRVNHRLAANQRRLLQVFGMTSARVGLFAGVSASPSLGDAAAQVGMFARPNVPPHVENENAAPVAADAGNPSRLAKFWASIKP